MSLFAIKPLESILAQAGDAEHSLKRTLGPFSLVALGIGAVIGAGIFTLTGQAAGDHAGPAIVLSFIIAAIGCGFAGLCYSEFATMIPIAGSAYTYAYATMGELMAWIIGWDLVMEYAIGAATVSVGWSGHVLDLMSRFGVAIPPRLAASPFEMVRLADGTSVHGIANIPALLIIIVISFILVGGIKESATVNSIIVVLKVSVVIFFILIGWAYMNPANHTPFIPANTGSWGHFGWSGVLRGSGVIFFAYIGFDAVSTAAQEASKPKRDMPIGIIGSLVVCTILFVLYAYVLTGVVNYKDFMDPRYHAAPITAALARMPYPILSIAMDMAIIAGLTSVMLVMLLGQSRVFYSMSRDGLLPRVFSDIHPKFRTPWRSNLLMMCFVGVFSALVPISILGEMTSIGTLFAFVIVCIGIMVMRRTRPDVPRAFKTPLVPLVPILGILFNFLMIFALGVANWLRLFIWLAIGLAIYFGYSRYHSKLGAVLSEKPAPSLGD
ncbi:MAG TPA: amino acid permease [Bryobacteraceae bacterium]|nr:amino acid permease [Bryobacteraceae bacterium]